MKRLQAINFTRNSNLVVYLGAYIDKIFNLVILDSLIQFYILFSI